MRHHWRYTAIVTNTSAAVQNTNVVPQDSSAIVTNTNVVPEDTNVAPNVICYYKDDGSYNPVTPCRIVDTRKTSTGIIGASTERDFRVFGSVALSVRRAAIRLVVLHHWASPLAGPHQHGCGQPDRQRQPAGVSGGCWDRSRAVGQLQHH